MGIFGWKDTIEGAINKIAPIIDQAVVDKDAAFKAKFELERMRTKLMLSTGNFSVTKWTICALVTLVVVVGSYMFLTDHKTMEAFKDYVLAVTPVIGILIGAYGTGKMFKKLQMERLMDEEREAIISLNDFHVPYHDEKAIDVAFKFVKFLRPYRIVIHELLDWYSLSRFDKDPNRKLDLKKNKTMAIEYLQRIRDMFPETDIIMLKSNHDNRLIKYLRTKAEELHNLDELQLPSLLKLKELNIGYKADYSFRNVLFKHGDIIRKYSGYTARAELEKEGVSGCSGHTHRLGTHFQTLRGGKYVWLETGCLCDPKQAEYIEGTANWQQGVGGFIFKKNSNHFYPMVVPIIDYEIIWGSKTFN